MSPLPRPFALIACISSLLAACAGAPPAAETPAVETPAPRVSRVADVEWQPLNPARGDASPRAATLWGDRAGEGPTGFLVRFADGFSSPPHIHNVSYRGVVISGRVHNADAAAPPLWMPTGSFWTQPKGGAHITAAQGESVAYIEIDSGPYLVRPVDAAFDAGEVPLNLHAANLVWSATAGGPQLAYLWGAPSAGGPSGYMVKLPAGTATLRGGALRAVVVQGVVALPDEKGPPLAPGSGVRADGALRVTCEAACLLHVGARGPLTVGTP